MRYRVSIYTSEKIRLNCDNVQLNLRRLVFASNRKEPIQVLAVKLVYSNFVIVCYIYSYS